WGLCRLLLDLPRRRIELRLGETDVHGHGHAGGQDDREGPQDRPVHEPPAHRSILLRLASAPQCHRLGNCCARNPSGMSTTLISLTRFGKIPKISRPFRFTVNRMMSSLSVRTAMSADL